MSTVYTTAGGRRFHADPECRALESAQALNDWDDIQPWLAPTLHRVEPRQPLAAALAGYTACRVCVPPALALPATGETYGHEPATGIGWFGEQETICARCTERGLYWGDSGDLRPVHVMWPCTSAVVLGLVPRCPDCGRPADARDGRKCRSCEHDDQIDALGTAL